MLRKFAAALLATTLIAGPAFAAQPSGNAGSNPAASAAAAPASGTNAVTKQTAKPTKTVKHARKDARRHVARGKVGTIKVSRHFKSTKTHRHHVAAHVVKPAKVGKGAKSAKSAKTTRG
jgi:hypothetical protein